MRAFLLSLCALAALSGCRDEQAGPRRRAQAPQPGGAQTVAAVPPLTWTSGATFAGGAVVYHGSTTDPAAPRAGQNVVLTHYFTAVQPQPAGYRFFVHVVDVASGQQVGNLDHEIQGGAAPLGTWPRGKVVVDRHEFQMPQYPGALQLHLGFWNDAGRLVPDDARFNDGAQRVYGPKLEGPQAALPEYRAPRASTAPVIDGALDDAAWTAATEVVLKGSFDGRDVTRRTAFRVLWDDEFLYVAFDAEDTDVWGSLRKKDDPIYNEDVVEVFIDADGDGATYNELQVSPHNVNFDASFVARRSDLPTAMQWESGMTTAVKVKGTLDNDGDRDERWTAEMKIPLKSLTSVPRLPPAKGDRWRFNAYRLEHLTRRTQIEGQAFSPLFVGDFHHLPRFGWLVFD